MKVARAALSIIAVFNILFNSSCSIHPAHFQKNIFVSAIQCDFIKNPNDVCLLGKIKPGTKIALLKPKSSQVCYGIAGGGSSTGPYSSMHFDFTEAALGNGCKPDSLFNVAILHPGSIEFHSTSKKRENGFKS
jgi:hypothetical protein